MKTIESLMAIAYPHGNAPAFEYTAEFGDTLSHVAKLARKESREGFAYLYRLQDEISARKLEAVEATATVKSLMGLPAPALVERWSKERALEWAIGLLKAEIADVEAALTSLDEMVNAAADLSALSSCKEGTTLAEMYQHREQQAAELERLDREHRERIEAEAEARRIAEAEEVKRIEEMSIEKLLEFLFTNPWPHMTNALVHGQKEGSFNRNNFSETQATLLEYFGQHKTGVKRRALERLWERFEQVAYGAVYKQYPGSPLLVEASFGRR